MYPPNHQSVHQKQRVSSQVIQSYILEWGYHDASKLWNVKSYSNFRVWKMWSFIYSPSSQAENYNRIWH